MGKILIGICLLICTTCIHGHEKPTEEETSTDSKDTETMSSVRFARFASEDDNDTRRFVKEESSRHFARKVQMDSELNNHDYLAQRRFRRRIGGEGDIKSFSDMKFSDKEILSVKHSSADLSKVKQMKRNALPLYHWDKVTKFQSKRSVVEDINTNNPFTKSFDNDNDASDQSTREKREALKISNWMEDEERPKNQLHLAKQFVSLNSKKFDSPSQIAKINDNSLKITSSFLKQRRFAAENQIQHGNVKKFNHETQQFSAGQGYSKEHSAQIFTDMNSLKIAGAIKQALSNLNNEQINKLVKLKENEQRTFNRDQQNSIRQMKSKRFADEGTTEPVYDSKSKLHKRELNDEATTEMPR